MPPNRDQGEPEEARIVSQLGKEFNIDEIYNGESSFIGSLKSINDFQPVEVAPGQPLKFDEAMLEVCVLITTKISVVVDLLLNVHLQDALSI